MLEELIQIKKKIEDIRDEVLLISERENRITAYAVLSIVTAALDMAMDRIDEFITEIGDPT